LFLTKHISIFFCLVFGVFSFSQQTNIEVIAKIETLTIANVLSVDATVSSRTELIKSLRYDLFTYRKNAQTTEVTKEEASARFVLQPSEKKTLKKFNLNTGTKDKVTVVLLIYDQDNKLIAKDRRVVLNDDEDNKKQVVKKEPPREDDYVGLRGIVVEKTKTKPGRDFYLDFYSNYRLKGINGKQVVNVVEQFSFGVNTIMEVSVGNTIVHRFFLQPKRDYIEQQSRIAIVNVSRYFLNLERQKSYIRQY